MIIAVTPNQICHNFFSDCQMNSGNLHVNTIFKRDPFVVASFRILHKSDGPSGALIVIVQLNIIDKSDGSCFKLTTPYFVWVIISSHSGS